MKRVGDAGECLAGLVGQAVQRGGRVAHAQGVSATSVEVVLGRRRLRDLAILGLYLAAEPVDVDDVENVGHRRASIVSDLSERAAQEASAAMTG